MTVFRGYLLIVKRNLGFLFMYVGIFLGITMMIQASYKESGVESIFQSKKMDIAVVSSGTGDVAKGLESMLKEKHHVISVGTKKKDLQEQMYYRNIEYVVHIPKNLDQELEHGKGVQVTKVPGSNSGYYMDQQINSYLSQIRLYQKGGFSVKDAVTKVSKAATQTPKVELVDRNGKGGQIPGYFYMFRFFPYMFICVLCYVMSVVIAEFQRKDVRNRMLCSKVSFRSQNLQIVAGFFIVGFAFWLFSNMLPILMFRTEYLSEQNIGYYIANSFVFLLVALSLAFFVGLVVKNTTALSGVVNVISLGMCFLGGIFVPLNMIGSGVKKVAQFLPSYWYSRANDLLGQSGVLLAKQKTELYTSFGMELAFAFACFFAALAFMRFRRQESGNS